MIQWFIGYDKHEIQPAYVLAHSIWENSSIPISITMLRRSQLPVPKERPEKSSTDFTDTRWLCPFLCAWQGWSIFSDCDMLMLGDVKELWDLRNPAYAVQVRQHDYEPKSQIKFLGQTNESYSRKNWSSLILFNNSRCHKLQPQYVREAKLLELHQFKWLSEAEIGPLPAKYNLLVGYQSPHKDTQLVHWTDGGPYFDDYYDVLYAAEYYRYARDMNYVQRK